MESRCERRIVMKKETNRTMEILGDFTKSYIEKTENLVDFKFGFKVNESYYIVNIKKDRSFHISQSSESLEIFSFVTDINTLEKIHSKEMTAMTAMGREYWDDKTPLDFINPEKIPENINIFKFIFSYFILDQPEKIKLKKEYARIVHGGYAIPMVYDEGLRTGWYKVEKGMIINENENQQTNPFPTLVIAIKGKGKVKIGDEKYNFEDGDAYYIDKNVSHSFWTDEEEGLEFIIIMYGEGA